MMALAIMLFLPLTAQSANSTFDHIATGFPLTGLHARVDCESCHVAGIFKGTPRECRACHARGSRISATVPPEDTTHNMNQQTECDQCHRSAGWTVAHFEHLGINSGCNLCHVAGGGGRAAPNDQVHSQIMGADCSDCHHSTRSFTSSAVLDHSGITSGCAAAGCHARDKVRARNHSQLTECQYCHRYPNWDGSGMDHDYIGATQCRTCHVSGGMAMASPSDQLHASVRNQDCSDCHTTTTFTGATIDHSLIVSGCAATGCHAADRMRAPNHGGLSSCESCHLYPNWSPVHNMNHSAIGTTLCKSCHTQGSLATTVAPNDALHASIGSQDCSSCHSTTTFVGGRVDHTFITTGCGASGCHASDKATAPNHTSLTSCESCHHFPSWTSVNMNHNAVGATMCRSCHVSGGLGTTAAPNDTVHADAYTGSRDCSACHFSTSTFAGAGVDHSTITSGCGVSGCHAADKTRAANHAQLNSCEACHSFTRGWTNPTMNHSAIGSSSCNGCHRSGGSGTPPPNDSIHANLGTQDCGACHSTSSFTGAKVDHSTITTGCAAAGCHDDDKLAAGSSHTQLNSCESCHSYSRGWNSASMNHNAIGATRCDSCHLYFSNAGLGRGSPNDSRHRDAQSRGRDCSACHSTRGGWD
jgi:hypothetical protein